MKINQGTDYSALFSSVTGGSSNSFSLNDYASIKNGSYGKLMKAYYGKDGNAAKSTAAKSSAGSKKLDETSTKNMNSVSKTAGEFKKATEAVTSAVASGDTEKVYAAAKDFADKYNSLMSAAGKVSNKSIERVATNLMDEVASNLKLLNKAGIKMSDKGEMSVDESAIKAEGNTALKSLFGKSGSFSDMVGNKASSIANKASSAVKVSSSYTAKASYNKQEVNMGDFYDSFT